MTDIAPTIVLDDDEAAAYDAQEARDQPLNGSLVHADAIHGVLSKHPEGYPFYPTEDMFTDGDDFLDAPEYVKLAMQLIDRCPCFDHLKEKDALSLRVAWKRKGGTSGQRSVMGKCLKLSGPARHYSKATFLIWLAADHCSAASYTNAQMEALLFHELKHIGYTVDENPRSPTAGEMKLCLVGHDCETFFDDLRYYGAWNVPRRELVRTVNQLALPTGGPA